MAYSIRKLNDIKEYLSKIIEGCPIEEHKKLYYEYYEYIKSVRSQSTTRTYLFGLCSFIKYKNYNVELSGNINLNEYIVYLTNQEYDAYTITSYVYGIVNFYKFIKSKGMNVEVNPFTLPKKSIRLKRGLSREQVNQFISEVSNNINEPYRSAFMILPFCGLRISELINLKKSNVIIEDVDGKKHILFDVIGKGNKERIVPLLPEGVNILREFIKSDYYAYTLDSDYLFATKRFKRLNELYIDRLMWKISSKLGFKIRVHTLRSTFATRLISAGMDTITIMKILGHSSPTTTAIYDRPTIQEMINRINGKFKDD